MIPIALPYFQEQRAKDNAVYSIDNIVLDYRIPAPRSRDTLIDILEDFCFHNYCETTHWTNYRMGAFKENITIHFPDGHSFWIGIGLNSAKTLWNRVRMDFNPNKVAIHTGFREILAYLNLNSSKASVPEVKRFDLAIDLPVQRENVFLVKDSRLYSERRHGQEHTQYLGRKSNPGHVKLYNKQVESNLPNPLTRLELTLQPNTYSDMQMPTVYYLADMQMMWDDFQLTQTQRFILNAILDGYGSPAQLSRKTRKTIEQAMAVYIQAVTVPPKVYANLMYQLYVYTRYPVLPLDERNLDPDQPPKKQAPAPIAAPYDRFVEIDHTEDLPFG